MIFWEMPMAATASGPWREVKLFSTVMPVTLRRFWMAEGMPTAQTPITIPRSKRSCRGEREI